MAEIVEVCTEAQIVEVARLAREIWREHYTPIIGQAQVEYMIEKFQSEKAITEQIANGYEYYLLVADKKNVGYLAIMQNKDESSLLLSKIYVMKAMQGYGYGREMLLFTENLCRQRHIKTLWLTVNKNNNASIAWYLHRGFTNAGPIVQDIGGGFVMDDFRMEKMIALDAMPNLPGRPKAAS